MKEREIVITAIYDDNTDGVLYFDAVIDGIVVTMVKLTLGTLFNTARVDFPHVTVAGRRFPVYYIRFTREELKRIQMVCEVLYMESKETVIEKVRGDY